MKHLKQIFENFNPQDDLIKVENIFSTFGEDSCKISIDSGSVKIEIDPKKHPLFDSGKNKVVSMSSMEDFRNMVQKYEEQGKTLNEFLNLLKRYLNRLEYNKYSWEMSPINVGTTGLPSKIFLRVFFENDPFSPIMKYVGSDKKYGKSIEFNVGGPFLMGSTEQRIWNKPNTSLLNKRKVIQDIFQNEFGLEILSYYVDYATTGQDTYDTYDTATQRVARLRGMSTRWDRKLIKRCEGGHEAVAALIILLRRNQDPEKIKKLTDCLDDMIKSKKIESWHFENTLPLPPLTGEQELDNARNLQKEYHLKQFFSDNEIKEFLNKQHRRIFNDTDPLTNYLNPSRSLEEELGPVLIIREDIG